MQRGQSSNEPVLNNLLRAIAFAADRHRNLRDIATSPPAGWSLERKQEYFDWAKVVVDALRGAHPGLEALFDETYRAGKAVPTK